MKRIIVSLIILLALLTTISFAETEIEMITDKDYIKKDEEINVEVNITNTNVAALTLEIFFDNTNLEYIGEIENANYSNNRIIYTWVSEDGKNKNIVNIGIFKFKAKQEEGTANIVVEAEGYNENGNTVNINSNNIEVKILKENVAIQNNETTNESTSTDNVDLKVLRLNHEGISPDFSKDIKEYYFIADSSIKNLEVTAIPENSKAIVKISGNNNLKMGLNTINIDIQSEDKTKNNNYKIYVTRTNDIEKANANLENLAIRQVTISPEFDENITNYRVNVDNSVNSVDILAIPINIKAKAEVSNTKNLQIGDNIIEVVVIAEDGITKKKYEINVHRRNEQEEAEYEAEQKQQAEKLSFILEEQKNEENANANNGEIEENMKDIIPYIILVVAVICITVAIIVIKKKEK